MLSRSYRKKLVIFWIVAVVLLSVWIIVEKQDLHISNGVKQNWQEPNTVQVEVSDSSDDIQEIKRSLQSVDVKALDDEIREIKREEAR